MELHGSELTSTSFKLAQIVSPAIGSTTPTSDLDLYNHEIEPRNLNTDTQAGRLLSPVIA